MKAPSVDPASLGERQLLLLLAAIQFTVITDFMTVPPISPVLMAELAIGPRAIGWLVAVYTLAAAGMGLVSAVASDRFDRRHWLLFLYGGFVLSLLVCGFAPNFTALLIGRALCGAFAGVIGATIMTVVGDIVPEARRGRATGMVMSAFAVATVAGVPFSLLAADRFGSRAPFLILAALALLMWVVAWRRVPSIGGHLAARRAREAGGEKSPAALRQLVETMREPAHRRAYLLILLVVSGGFLVIPYISMHLVLDVGVPVSELPIIYLVGGAATFVSARVIGTLSDRLGKTTVFRFLALAAVIPFLAVTHLPPVSVWTAALIVMLFFVLVSGRFVPMMAIATTVPRPPVRGGFMSLMQTVQSLVQGVATTIGGLILGQTPEGQLLHFDKLGWLAVGTTLIAWYWVGKVRPAEARPGGQESARQKEGVAR